MMAAYPTAGMQPGLAHPGVASTPSQLGQPMMHPGVSGPGQPHANPANAMMAMQQGAMPAGQPQAVAGMGMPQPGQAMAGQSVPSGAAAAHAMQQLNPQHLQMLQQFQLQHSQMNIHQQRMMAQQQHQQQQRQQQLLQAQMVAQQANSMGRLQSGAMQLNPQMHFHPGAGFHPPGTAVQLPPHLKQQQQNAEMQLAQRYAHSQSHQAHIQQQQQQQQGMQHANSQQSNASQAGHGANSQMRPPSRVANAHGASPGVSQAHHQGGPVKTVHTPQPSQTPQIPPPPSQPPPQMPMPAQRVTMPMQQQQQHQLQRLKQVQQAQIQAQAQQQQQRRFGSSILRINQFADHLGNFDQQRGLDLTAWHEFVDKHFHEKGRLMHSFDDSPTGGKGKRYEVMRANIARYFYMWFMSGTSGPRLHTEDPSESVMPGGRLKVHCSRATLSAYFPNGLRWEMSGSLMVLFAQASDEIECLELRQTNSEEVLSMAEIERVLADTSTDNSPKLSKGKLPKQRGTSRLEGLTIAGFPRVPKGSLGVTSRVQQFLEIAETMNFMEDLMVISQEKEVTPGLALETWNAQMEAQGAPQAGQQQQQQQQQAQTAVGFAPNGVPMMARTPSMQSMAMSAQAGAFPSPHVAQMQLPNGINGSPHFGYAPAMAASYTFPPGAHAMSPRQGAMAAPLMMAQRSQQGTNSSAASGTTSPTVNNKRRRSAAKGMEDDGGEVHGMQRMKPSPRIAKKSKPGG